MRVITSAALPGPCPIPGREPRTTRVGLAQTRWYDSSDVHTEQLRERLEDAYPGRDIRILDARELFAMGGGIHLITQQQPSAVG